MNAHVSSDLGVDRDNQLTRLGDLNGSRELLELDLPKHMEHEEERSAAPTRACLLESGGNGHTCSAWLPTQSPTSASPIVESVGTFWSSAQMMVHGWPPCDSRARKKGEVTDKRGQQRSGRGKRVSSRDKTEATPVVDARMERDKTHHAGKRRSRLGDVDGRERGRDERDEEGEGSEHV